MDGALIVDKPEGMTSHTVVAHVRRIVGIRRVGHTGTLDPFATGVLVVLIGKATRLVQFLSGAEKQYEAVVRFGVTTDTGDITGRELERSVGAPTLSDLTAAQIDSAIASLRGEIEQVPPMYSAKKVKGRRLYELARRGEEIERQPVRVNIKAFEVVASHDLSLRMNDDRTADLKVNVVCSAGTYIRTLAEDLGKRLGVGAHLAALRRTRAGAFAIAEAHTLDQLKEMAETNSLQSAIITPDTAVSHLAALKLDDDEVRRAMNGVAIKVTSKYEPDQRVRLRTPTGDLLGVGTYDSTGEAIRPQVVLAGNQ